MPADAQDFKKVEQSFEAMPYIGDENIPTVVVDGYWGVLQKEGTVRLNLVEERFDPASERVAKVAVLRLVIENTAFLNIVEGLSQVAAHLRAVRTQAHQTPEEAGDPGVTP